MEVTYCFCFRFQQQNNYNSTSVLPNVFPEKNLLIKLTKKQEKLNKFFAKLLAIGM